MSWEDHVEWELANQLSIAWDRGYHDAMSFAMKAVTGIPLASPTNPYEMERP